MQISLADKRVLVTGATRGIGRGIADAVHACGGHVIAVARTQADLDKMATQLPGITTFACDLSDWEAARTLMESVGPVDCLVNNAGFGELSAVMEDTSEYVDRVIALNVKAALNLSQVVAKSMTARGQGGCIVNISSLAGIRPFPLGFYGITKSALDQMTRLMAVELGPRNIRVNSVNPTVVETDLSKELLANTELSGALRNATPLRKFPGTEDVANAVVFLLSDKAAFITGVLLPVDGGYCSA